MDSHDRQILAVLQREGRISNTELAERVGLSASPCWRRVRALEEAGTITGYVALLSPRRLGLGLTAFVHISLDLHHAPEFEEAISRRREVVECWAMAGDQDYLLRIVAPDMAAFDSFVRAELIRMPGVDRVRSEFALTAIKSTTALPLDLA